MAAPASALQLQLFQRLVKLSKAQEEDITELEALVDRELQLSVNNDEATKRNAVLEKEVEYLSSTVDSLARRIEEPETEAEETEAEREEREAEQANVSRVRGQLEDLKKRNREVRMAVSHATFPGVAFF